MNRNMIANRTIRALGKNIFKQRNVPIRCLASAPDYIVESPVPGIDSEKGNFVSSCLKGLADRQNKTALICSDTDRTLTFGQYRDCMARWGSFLDKQGISKGSVVAVLSPNTIDYSCVAYGTMAAGRIFTGMNPMNTPEEVAHHIEDSGAKMLIVFGLLEPVARKAMEILKKNLPLFSIGPPSPGSLPRVEQIMNDPNMGLAEIAELQGDEIAAILYSSGTTGKPKGVAIDHNAITASQDMLAHPKFYVAPLCKDQENVTVTQLFPLFHVAGLAAIGASGLKNGLKLLNIAKFDPNSYLDKLIKHKVNGVHMIPSMMNYVLAHPKFTAKNFENVAAILSGAAPIPQSTAERIVDRLEGQARFFHGYGMTEMLFTHQDPIDETRFGFTGQMLPGLQGKVVDLETGAALPALKQGEICLRGPTMMKGYHNNPKATDQVIDSEGWFHTGDVGAYDDDGFFKVVDRTKELIKVNAYQVSPSELEDIILRIPEVVEVGVIGVPHPKTGEAPRAYVRTSSPITEKKVYKQVEQLCAKFKHLTGGVRFIDDFPRNGTGKIMKKELKKFATAEN